MKLLLPFFLTLIFNITLSSAQSCGDTIRTDIKGFAFGHSLFNHGLPPVQAHEEFTSTGYWLGILAQLSGTKSSHGGMYGQLDSWNQVWETNGGPPNRLNVNYIFSSNNGDEEFWPWDNSTFEEKGFNLFYFMTPNFVQTWQPDPQYYQADAVQLLDNIHSVYPGEPIYLYIHWPKTQLAAEHNGTTFGQYADLTDAEFSIYNEYTSGAYWDWHKNLYDILKEERPDYPVYYIPVGQVIADVLETAPFLSSLQFNDLYHDDGPHGLTDLYFLAGLVTYRAIYGQNPDVSTFAVPAEVPALLPAIVDNLSTLVLDIESRLALYCSEPLSNDNPEVFSDQIRLFPNPSGDFIAAQNVGLDFDAFTFQITDLNGNIILSGKSAYGENIDVKNLKQGMYILRVEYSSKSFHRKFVRN